MIPNGVLLINKATKAIAFANKEIMNIIGANAETQLEDLKDKVTNFVAERINTYRINSQFKDVRHYLKRIKTSL